MAGFLVFPPVTVAIVLQDHDMVHGAVDGRYGHQGVGRALESLYAALFHTELGSLNPVGLFV